MIKYLIMYQMFVLKKKLAVDTPLKNKPSHIKIMFVLLIILRLRFNVQSIILGHICNCCSLRN